MLLREAQYVCFGDQLAMTCFVAEDGYVISRGGIYVVAILHTPMWCGTVAFDRL